MKRYDNNEELEQLIFKEIDGVCSEEEFVRLNDILASDPKAVDYYLELITLCSGLRRSGEMLLPVGDRVDGGSQNISDIWKALAEDERKAEAVPIEHPEVIEHPVIQSNKKRSLFTFFTAISVAACFFIIISILVMNRPQIYMPVAKITDNSGAVWQSIRDCSVGSRLYTGTVMKLVDGYSEITFDNTAKIVIQSPSIIVLEDDNRMYLQSGKLSAVVPPPAKGFLVRTNGASIVDYGTEFGVVADMAGNTETHVFVGEVELRSGVDPIRFEESLRLEGGQASSVNDGVMSDMVPASPMSFVRSIPEKETFGIPGKRLDLADILGGGNGLGTGEKDISINPFSGVVSSGVTMTDRRTAEHSYSPVANNICIDGVFVPIGGRQTVTSAGHNVLVFPETDRRYWTDISNRPVTGMAGDNNGPSDEFKLANIEGVQYGNEKHPAIMVHPNTGITFDLDSIRSMNPGVEIKSFSSLCALSGTLAETDIWDGVKAVMWVIVDGKMLKKLEITSDVEGKSNVRIEVPIASTDRFLTLATTDGQNGNVGDWTLFGDPALELELFN